MPNAPPIFVGRVAERARLEEILRLAPVAVVWGLGGLGKTSLVLRVLHDRLGGDTARALFVSLSAADASPRVAVDVLRALCAAQGVRSVDWQSLLADEQALVESAIDVAERGAHTIVIDDLQHGDPESTAALLRTVNRYARHSRWVATSRVDWPLPELEGQRLALGTMNSVALTELAQRLDDGLGAREVAALVERAAGSPWRMRLALGSDGAAADGNDVFHGLAPAAIELMLALVPVEVALRKGVLASALAEVPAEAWSALERRGIIEGRGGGWRLHDMARVLVRECHDPARIAAYGVRMSEVLASSDEPAAWLEALRLSLARGAHASALAQLEARGGELFVGGYAPELWRLLEPVQDRALARWRLRSGAELGTPEVLAQLRAPVEPTPDEQIAWGQALFAMGRMQESAEVVSSALKAARAAGSAAPMVDAELLLAHAQTLASMSRQSETLEMLRAIAAGQTELQRRALAAKVYALMGVFEAALTSASRIMAECAALPPSERLLVYLDILAVYLSLGRMYDAQDVSQRIERECGDVSMALYNTRYLLVLSTSVTTHLGLFQSAHGHLDEVLPFTGRSAVQRPILVSLRLWLRLVQGELADMDAQIDQVNRDFVASANEYFMQWGRVLESYHARSRGRPELPRMEDPPALTGAGGNLLRVYRLLHRARRGALPSAVDLAFLNALYPECYLWALGRLVPAHVALLAGDDGAAAREAGVAVQALTRLGNLLYASEAEEALAEALLLGRRLDELARVAASLAAKGRDFPSQRLALVAELYQMAASGSLAPAVLERLAAAEQVAPVACRRARALLGAAAPLDVIDQRVVAELARRDRVVVSVVGASGVEPSEWTPGWGLDGLRRAVWLSDGRVVSFEEHPVRWACLEALARLGGAASREALVPVIWPGEAYDPLVHNNRLNPMIRKLRLALEDDPARPARLVTTADGYGFGDAVPVRWLRAGTSPATELASSA